MPNGLFKYFPTDGDKLERFTNGQIYLTPPKYFNDPWDFLLRSEPPTEELLKKEVPFLHPASMPEFQEYVSSADSLEDEAHEQQDGLSKIIGLVCLTEKPLDRLMWAHYAECHQGFVAEFGHSGDEAKTEHGFPNHFSSRRNSSSVAVRKYFCPLCAGCPSGLSRPLAIRIGISCAKNPRNQAACSAVTRAGGICKFKKRSISCCILPHSNPAADRTRPSA